MKRGTRLALALAATLAVLAALLATQAAPNVELGPARTNSRSLSPRLAAALERVGGAGEISLCWFREARADLPSGWSAVDDALSELFSTLESSTASRTRVRTLIVEPRADAQAASYATRVRVTPFAQRSVRADGWSEVEVWSALRIVAGARGVALVPAITPELAPALQDLVAAELEELAAPTRAHVAVAAPQRFARLRTELGARADVRDCDFEESARIAPEVELLVWIEPARVDARHVRELESFLQRGGSVWIAGAGQSARWDGSRLLVDEDRAALEALLPHFGLRARPGIVFDRLGSELALRVASIGEAQDFRELASEPRGNLFFESASALEPDFERLEQLGLRVRALAASANSARVLAPAAREMSRAELEVRARAQAPRSALLLAELVPTEPWRGSLAVAGSSSPFEDRELADRAAAHPELVQVLLEELAGSSRVARRALAASRPQPLRELTSAERTRWRALVVLLPAAAMLACALLFFVRRTQAARGARRTGTWRARLALLGLALVIALAASLPGRVLPASASLVDARTTRRAWPSALASLASEHAARGEPVRVLASFSPDESLPPELRPLARTAFERLEALSSELPAIEARRSREPVGPEHLERAEPEGGVPVLRTTSRLDEGTQVRFIHASIAFASGPRRVRLDFASARDFEELDFKLALALWRVLEGGDARLGFAAGDERLSPAEALLEYQREGRFAPQQATRFQAARALLAGAGFELVDLDPRKPDAPADLASFVWLAPQRDASPLGRVIADRLAPSGRALIALQRWRLRPVRRAASAGGLALWPEPQFADLDERWLPRLGLSFPREVVADERHGAAHLRVKLERELARASSRVEDVRGIWLPRASATQAARDAFGAAQLGEPLLALPTRIELDGARLAHLGLRAEPWLVGSRAARTSSWRGGDLPEELAVPGSGATADARSLAEPVFAVRVHGTFPGAEIEPQWKSTPAPARNATTHISAARESELVLVGCAEAFSDELLESEPDNARLLLALASRVGLPDEFTALLGARPLPPTFDAPGASERGAWRAGVVLGAPLCWLGAGLWFAWRRRRGPARFTTLLAAGVRA